MLEWSLEIIKLMLSILPNKLKSLEMNTMIILSWMVMNSKKCVEDLLFSMKKLNKMKLETLKLSLKLQKILKCFQELPLNRNNNWYVDLSKPVKSLDMLGMVITMPLLWDQLILDSQWDNKELIFPKILVVSLCYKTTWKT